ncbi:YolD-like family protein [Brevibacillus sp. GCM10020057]|uniref:YolD-like family protein n=1 Tax=Brevibacillus sp. GCM10020057 TaxID=3317327 RepID=UPI00362B4CC4
MAEKCSYPSADGFYGGETSYVQRPVVAEDDFGEMCFRIYDSTQYHYPIHVKWFVRERGSYGSVHSAWGLVREIDVKQYAVKLVGHEQSCWIKVEDIVSVSRS